MLNILLLEDDLTLAETLVELLQDEGYQLTWVKDGESALEMTFKNCFDLMLLDINVPVLNGFSTLKSLRDASIDTPAIFLSSLDDINSLAKGFEVGANDYVKKPFDFDELLIRIQALIRKNYKSHTDIIKLNNFSFHINKGELYKENEYISLTQYEQRLVKLFFQGLNRTILKEDILFELARGREASEGALRVRINKLRKLGLPIVTIKSVGYRLEKG